MTEADQPQATDSSTAQAEYDSPWKEALEVYFEPFLALLFPAVHELIDGPACAFEQKVTVLNSSMTESLGM